VRAPDVGRAPRAVAIPSRDVHCAAATRLVAAPEAAPEPEPTAGEPALAAHAAAHRASLPVADR